VRTVTDHAPLVADVHPELAARLEESLREQGEDALAAQVSALRVTVVCTCDSNECGSFYTTERPMRRWFQRGRQVDLGPGLPGLVTVDVIAGRIDYVEVLFWDEVRDAVTALAR
jgi:hypothetical protein